jgi:hypothetical protein
MSVEADLQCVYRAPGIGKKESCNCGGAGYYVGVFRCLHPEHKDFCTLSRYDKYQQERICQFCPKRTDGPLTKAEPEG